MKVAVIGAGPSGLVTCKTLRESGIDACCFEAGDEVGGQWVIDNSSGMSSAYESLRTNTNREMSRFSDFAFPSDYPEYPGHPLMAAWFRDYAIHFDILPHIRFSSKVARVEPVDGGFELTSNHTTERFDAVVCATGNLWDPVLPNFSGEFSGIQMHAHDYRSPMRPFDLRDKTVLVVGLGNSGCELAAELSTCSRVILSARSGQTILPRVPTGGRTPPHPAEPLDYPFSVLPRGIRDALFRFIMPKVMRKMLASRPAPESVGLPPAPEDLFAKRSVVNDDIIDLLSAQRIATRSNVRRLSGTEVEFEDGHQDQVDAIIYATGYRFTLPYLSEQVLGVADAEDLSLYQGIMHPKHHGLFVVGVVRALCSIWPLSEQQARWISALLTSRFELPRQDTVQARAYPILQTPLQNCQFTAADLRSEARLT